MTLWKYCTPKQHKELLLSFDLFSGFHWSAEKQIACLYAISKHPSRHYSALSIPKKNGGTRSLFIPDPLLKRIQRNILEHILQPMSISPHATAYCKGGNIIHNAAAHVQQKQILKLDIEDFFTTIDFRMVYSQAFPAYAFPPAIRALLTHLCCYQDCLPQGAPTSAAISNLVMNPFDKHLGSWCTQQNIVYTRYCDDMAFSGEFDFHQVTNKVCSFLWALGFRLNQKKTRWLTEHQQQIVTGLVVNTKVQVPTTYRKTLRQEIYYCQKFGVASHLLRINDTAYLSRGLAGEKSYLSVLLGKIHFVLQADPKNSYFQKSKRWIQQQLS